jgi:ATP-dependent DNA ligase
MRVVDILRKIKETRGMNAKKDILIANSENKTLINVLRYGLDTFMTFNVVKVPKTNLRIIPPGGSEEYRFDCFFSVADCCSTRMITGNEAVNSIEGIFASCTEEEEFWMRKILLKNLAIGVSTKTVNKVFPDLIKTFNVSLAQKFDMKRIIHLEEVIIEPKLDGIRCFAIVEDGNAMLFARSGKLISNFDGTIGRELVKLGDGCYDGELMGKDFTDLMRQAYRKDDANVDDAYLALFDYVPMEEWKIGMSVMTCHERNEVLLDKLAESNVDLSVIQPVERMFVDVSYSDIKEIHDDYVSMGYEGAMVKDPTAPYKFGRGYEVMKLKVFHDVDLPIKAFLEGSGKHTGKLGSVIVCFNGVDVQVGSGFSDSLREAVWNDKDQFVGRVIEVRYQEVTPDGSLRFPTFVCFRNDR